MQVPWTFDLQHQRHRVRDLCGDRRRLRLFPGEARRRAQSDRRAPARVMVRSGSWRKARRVRPVPRGCRRRSVRRAFVTTWRPARIIVARALIARDRQQSPRNGPCRTAPAAWDRLHRSTRPPRRANRRRRTSGRCASAVTRGHIGECDHHRLGVAILRASGFPCFTEEAMSRSGIVVVMDLETVFRYNRACSRRRSPRAS